MHIKIKYLRKSFYVCIPTSMASAIFKQIVHLDLSSYLIVFKYISFINASKII